MAAADQTVPTQDEDDEVAEVQLTAGESKMKDLVEIYVAAGLASAGSKYNSSAVIANNKMFDGASNGAELLFAIDSVPTSNNSYGKAYVYNRLIGALEQNGLLTFEDKATTKWSSMNRTEQAEIKRKISTLYADGVAPSLRSRILDSALIKDTTPKSEGKKAKPSSPQVRLRGWF